MDWTSLIPIGASLLGGLFGGEKKTTTETQAQNSPELEAAAKAIFERAMGVFSKPYPDYTGERVAGPTAARAQLGEFLPSLTNSVTGAMKGSEGYQKRVDGVLGRTPVRVQVPTLLDGGTQSRMSGGSFGDGMSSGFSGATGGAGGAGILPADALAMAKNALPRRNFDQSWVAFDPKKAV